MVRAPESRIARASIELTDAGREAARGIPVVLCQIQNAHLAGFSVDEYQALMGFLRRILDNAQALHNTVSGGPNEA